MKSFFRVFTNHSVGTTTKEGKNLVLIVDAKGPLAGANPVRIKKGRERDVRSIWGRVVGGSRKKKKERARPGGRQDLEGGDFPFPNHSATFRERTEKKLGDCPFQKSGGKTFPRQYDSVVGTGARWSKEDLQLDASPTKARANTAGPDLQGEEQTKRGQGGRGARPGGVSCPSNPTQKTGGGIKDMGGGLDAQTSLRKHS